MKKLLTGLMTIILVLIVFASCNPETEIVDYTYDTLMNRISEAGGDPSKLPIDPIYANMGNELLASLYGNSATIIEGQFKIKTDYGTFIQDSRGNWTLRNFSFSKWHELALQHQNSMENMPKTPLYKDMNEEERAEFEKHCTFIMPEKSTVIITVAGEGTYTQSGDGSWTFVKEETETTVRPDYSFNTWHALAILHQASMENMPKTPLYKDMNEEERAEFEKHCTFTMSEEMVVTITVEREGKYTQSGDGSWTFVKEETETTVRPDYSFNTWHALALQHQTSMDSMPKTPLYKDMNEKERAEFEKHCTFTMSEEMVVTITVEEEGKYIQAYDGSWTFQKEEAIVVTDSLDFSYETWFTNMTNAEGDPKKMPSSPRYREMSYAESEEFRSHAASGMYMDYFHVQTSDGIWKQYMDGSWLFKRGGTMPEPLLPERPDYSYDTWYDMILLYWPELNRIPNEPLYRDMNQEERKAFEEYCTFNVSEEYVVTITVRGDGKYIQAADGSWSYQEIKPSDGGIDYSLETLMEKIIEANGDPAAIHTDTIYANMGEDLLNYHYGAGLASIQDGTFMVHTELGTFVQDSDGAWSKRDMSYNTWYNKACINRETMEEMPTEPRYIDMDQTEWSEFEQYCTLERKEDNTLIITVDEDGIYTQHPDGTWSYENNTLSVTFKINTQQWSDEIGWKLATILFETENSLLDQVIDDITDRSMDEIVTESLLSGSSVDFTATAYDKNNMLIAKVRGTTGEITEEGDIYLNDMFSSSERIIKFYAENPVLTDENGNPVDAGIIYLLSLDGMDPRPVWGHNTGNTLIHTFPFNESRTDINYQLWVLRNDTGDYLGGSGGTFSIIDGKDDYKLDYDPEYEMILPGNEETPDYSYRDVELHVRTDNWDIGDISELRLTIGEAIYPPVSVTTNDVTLCTARGIAPDTSISYELRAYDANGNIIESLRANTEAIKQQEIIYLDTSFPGAERNRIIKLWSVNPSMDDQVYKDLNQYGISTEGSAIRWITRSATDMTLVHSFEYTTERNITYSIVGSSDSGRLPGKSEGTIIIEDGKDEYTLEEITDDGNEPPVTARPDYSFTTWHNRAIEYLSNIENMPTDPFYKNMNRFEKEAFQNNCTLVESDASISIIVVGEGIYTQDNTTGIWSFKAESTGDDYSFNTWWNKLYEAGNDASAMETETRYCMMSSDDLAEFNRYAPATAENGQFTVNLQGIGNYIQNCADGSWSFTPAADGERPDYSFATFYKRLEYCWPNSSSISVMTGFHPELIPSYPDYGQMTSAEIKQFNKDLEAKMIEHSKLWETTSLNHALKAGHAEIKNGMFHYANSLSQNPDGTWNMDDNAFLDLALIGYDIDPAMLPKYSCDRLLILLMISSLDSGTPDLSAMPADPNYTNMTRSQLDEFNEEYRQIVLKNYAGNIEESERYWNSNKGRFSNGCFIFMGNLMQDENGNWSRKRSSSEEKPSVPVPYATFETWWNYICYLYRKDEGAHIYTPYIAETVDYSLDGRIIPYLIPSEPRFMDMTDEQLDAFNKAYLEKLKEIRALTADQNATLISIDRVAGTFTVILPPVNGKQPSITQYPNGYWGNTEDGKPGVLVDDLSGKNLLKKLSVINYYGMSNYSFDMSVMPEIPCYASATDKQIADINYYMEWMQDMVMAVYGIQGYELPENMKARKENGLFIILDRFEQDATGAWYFAPYGFRDPGLLDTDPNSFMNYLQHVAQRIKDAKQSGKLSINLNPIYGRMTDEEIDDFNKDLRHKIALESMLEGYNADREATMEFLRSQGITRDRNGGIIMTLGPDTYKQDAKGTWTWQK